MATGFRSQHRPAKRRSRQLKLAIEPLFQYRRNKNGTVTTFRREGTLQPATHLLGRNAGILEAISNPAYLQITPAFDTNGNLIDIQRGDLFIRLKYLNGTDTTDTQAIQHLQRTRVNNSFEVHHFEPRYNVLRILGDLS